MVLKAMREGQNLERPKKEKLCLKPKMKADRCGYQYLTMEKALAGQSFWPKQKPMAFLAINQKKILPTKKFSTLSLLQDFLLRKKLLSILDEALAWTLLLRTFRV